MPVSNTESSAKYLFKLTLQDSFLIIELMLRSNSDLMLLNERGCNDEVFRMTLTLSFIIRLFRLALL